MIIFNEKVIAGTINGSDLTYTKRVKNRETASVQVKYSGTTISGSIKIQLRNHPDAEFIDMNDSEQTFTDNSGGFYWDVRGNFLDLKIVCTSSSGDVTFEGYLLLKRPKPTE